MMPGPTELAIIALVILLLFGGKQIPKFARGLAETIREFKSVKNDAAEIKTTIEKELKE
jgi:sec-independent protein translocase protein TatA